MIDLEGAVTPKSQQYNWACYVYQQTGTEGKYFYCEPLSDMGLLKADTQVQVSKSGRKKKNVSEHLWILSARRPEVAMI